jgi:hypothetical protein
LLSGDVSLLVGEFFGVSVDAVDGEVEATADEVKGVDGVSGGGRDLVERLVGLGAHRWAACLFVRVGVRPGIGGSSGAAVEAYD